MGPSLDEAVTRSSSSRFDRVPLLACGKTGGGDMFDLEAGTHPHIITRPCSDRADAERWAGELTRRGFVPITIDGTLFAPKAREIEPAE
jgi:hypothetical protein